MRHKRCRFRLCRYHIVEKKKGERRERKKDGEKERTLNQVKEEEEETTRIEARSDENNNTKEDNLKRSTERSRQRTPRKRKAGNTIFGIPETTNEISRPLSAPSAFELDTWRL